jgi:flagellar hook assembly protein FlgD
MGFVAFDMNASARIRFELPAAGVASIRIFDANGRLVQTLGDGPYSPGVHTVVWDGRNARGRVVASGAYFVDLVCGAKRQVMRMTLIR